MSGFHEVRFPDNIGYGATGGPEFATTVVATGAGHEQRNVNWAEARGRWDAASGLKNQAQLDALIGRCLRFAGGAACATPGLGCDHRAIAPAAPCVDPEDRLLRLPRSSEQRIVLSQQAR